MDAPSCIEFFFNGLPAGFFAVGVCPTEPGVYAYEPCRGVGHYALGQFFEQHGHADCVFEADGETTHFRVVGRPGYGRLVLADVQPGNL